jgi:hypothetical protein
MRESASGLSATKDDMPHIKIGMADIKAELKGVNWLFISLVAGILSLVANAYSQASPCNPNPQRSLTTAGSHWSRMHAGNPSLAGNFDDVAVRPVTFSIQPA